MPPPPPRRLRKVTLTTRQLRTTPRKPSTPLSPTLALLLLILLLLPPLATLYHLSQKFPPAFTLSVAVYILSINLWTVVLYWYDKTQASGGFGRLRIRESTLHFCELAGGWPGALWAQGWLRHKTRKGAFRVVFWAIVVGHEMGWYCALRFWI